jgi:hypothetical protein
MPAAAAAERVAGCARRELNCHEEEATMRTNIAVLTSFLMMLSGIAAAQDAPAAPRQDVAKAVPATKAKPADVADEDFVPPDGWLPKKQGKYTVYCRKDYNVRGTRFPAETCYDQKGIREMVLQERTDRERYDQLRRVCGNDATCGSH